MPEFSCLIKWNCKLSYQQKPPLLVLATPINKGPFVISGGFQFIDTYLPSRAVGTRRARGKRFAPSDFDRIRTKTCFMKKDFVTTNTLPDFQIFHRLCTVASTNWMNRSLFALVSRGVAKGGFFSESMMGLSNCQIKYSKSLSCTWILKLHFKELFFSVTGSQLSQCFCSEELAKNARKFKQQSWKSLR